MSAVPARPAPLTRLADALETLPGGERARARRAAALSRLIALGLPTPRDAAWKYTNLRLLERRELAPAAPRPLAADVLAALPELEAAALVFADGRHVAALDRGTLPAGARFTPLAALLDADLPGAPAARLAASDHVDERVRLLNAAFATDGGELAVAAGSTLERPLAVVHLAAAGGSYPRLLVTLAPGASACLVEYHVASGDAESLAAPVTDVELGAGARLEHYTVQLGHARAVQLADLSIRVSRDASYRHRHLAFGTQLARLDLRLRLEGAGATAALAGFLLADRAAQLDVRTLVEHVAPHAVSDQRYRGVATDRGRGSYDGKVVVHPGAAGSDSRQSSRNLLLSREAAIDTRPQLEINNDDVKCSHGATTGTLDEGMLFYLLARGLDATTARALLTYAFTADVLGLVGLPALRRYAEERVLGSLPAAALIREFVR